MMGPQITIMGAGGIGRAVALLLLTDDSLRCSIVLCDQSEGALNAADKWLGDAFKHRVKLIVFDTNAPYNYSIAFGDSKVLLDCLPGSYAPVMADIALRYRLHYVNLTEFVKETNEIVSSCRDAETAFVLQTGLAPGYINIVAKRLYELFLHEYEDADIMQMSMKVGALTKNAIYPHAYGFTWSPIGVATEYVEPATVIRDYKQESVDALSALNTIIIDNVKYEENLTSGGAADFPSFYEGKIKQLDYKTLRFPGHYEWVSKQLLELPKSNQRNELLQEVMELNIPLIEDDKVILYAAVEGVCQDGKLRRLEHNDEIYPMEIAGVYLKAIQITTAAPMATIAKMALEGQWSGIVRQSGINSLDFLNNPLLKQVYNHNKLL